MDNDVTFVIVNVYRFYMGKYRKAFGSPTVSNLVSHLGASIAVAGLRGQLTKERRQKCNYIVHVIEYAN